MNPQIANTIRHIAALVIVSCAVVGAPAEALAADWGLWKSVSGSGTLKTETRNVSGFTGIALSLDGSVEIRQGASEGVTVETDDNILPLIETVVENATLKIRPTQRNATFSTKKLKIVVNARNLDRIDIAGKGDIHADALKVADLKAGISGAGDLRIKSLDADALSISIAGSGDFEAGGRAANVRANIAGSGDIKAGNLDAKAVDINIAGSGDATVWARNSLKVSIAGSGDVGYYGDAQVQNSIWGSGSIKRLGAAP